MLKLTLHLYFIRNDSEILLGVSCTNDLFFCLFFFLTGEAGALWGMWSSGLCLMAPL